jgi:hypothetical protein
MKRLIRRIPVIGPVARGVYRALRRVLGLKPRAFAGSADYWERHYSDGGDSGSGSRARLAAFKAEVINGFVEEHSVESVIEFGCGDGNQLSLARYPRYLGFDISRAAIARCKKLYRNDPTKSFALLRDYAGQHADLTLSLDVIFHLVEDAVFEGHMRGLFGAADRYVIVYSSDADDPEGPRPAHVRHRAFTKWVRDEAPGWTLMSHIPNRYPYAGDLSQGSMSDFFIFERARAGARRGKRTAE